MGGKLNGRGIISGVDRRGFLKVLGVGGVVLAASPQLVLPKARSLGGVASRVFTPPTSGWPTANYDWLETSRALAEGVCRYRLGFFSERLDVYFDSTDVTIRPGDVLKLDTPHGSATVAVTMILDDGFTGRRRVTAMGVYPGTSYGFGERIVQPKRYDITRTFEPLLPGELLSVRTFEPLLPGELLSVRSA